MMRTRWAARQLAGSGGSGSGDLAHRAVSGASMASLRAVYGTADPHNKVPHCNSCLSCCQDVTHRPHRVSACCMLSWAGVC
jgi:hypothetical protein